MRPPRVTTVGFAAHAALARAGGHARVYARLTSSMYLTAAGEIIWLARGGVAHARAVLCDDLVAGLAGASVMVRVEHIAPWRPAPVPRTIAQAAAMVTGARRLGARLGALGAPRGFAHLCTGDTPPFPLDGSGPRARALAGACARGDAATAAAAAIALLGLGEGLTPSGDDFAGAAFFARALLARAGDGDAGRWQAAADAVMRAAPALTHPISVALLGDLLDGSAAAPLHDLAQALAMQAPDSIAEEAAHRLTRVGHTSGWDMLAGFVAGCAGLPG